MTVIPFILPDEPDFDYETLKWTVLFKFAEFWNLRGDEAHDKLKEVLGEYSESFLEDYYSDADDPDSLRFKDVLEEMYSYFTEQYRDYIYDVDNSFDSAYNISPRIKLGPYPNHLYIRLFMYDTSRMSVDYDWESCARMMEAFFDMDEYIASVYYPELHERRVSFESDST